MRRAQVIITYIFAAIFFFGCTGKGGTQREAPLADTIYTATAAMNIYGNQPERALAIIDSAVIVGNLDEVDASFFRAKIYSRMTTGHCLDTAWMICERLMESDYVENPDSRTNVLDLLVYITQKQCNYEQCLRWSMEKADFCREQGEVTEALRTEAEIGFLLAKLGEQDKGLEKLDAIIAKLDGQHNTDEMDACIIALKRKISVLQGLGREEEVIPLAQHIIDITNDYHEHYTAYTDNSYRLLPIEEDVKNYCEYYTAQAYCYLAHAHAVLATSGGSGKLTNHKKMARHYLTLFEQTSFGNRLEGQRAIAPTWCLLGDYDKMLATYDELEEQMGGDTLNFDYLEILRGRAEAATAFGQPYAAIDYWKHYIDLGSYLNDMIHKSHVHEYAVRYHLQEERLNTERERNARHNVVYIANSLGIGILIVVTFLVILLRRMHSIREKNAVLTKEITERIAYEEKFLELSGMLHTPAMEVGKGETSAKKDCGEPTTTDYQPLPIDYQPPTTNPDEMSDKELFNYIRYIIVKDNLHLNPFFGRDQLVERLHISKDRIGAAFSHGSEYPSLKHFLNDIRLLHSAKLLAECPEMPIAKVATACGFSNAAIFSRNFKQHFTITPTEFRDVKIREKND